MIPLMSAHPFLPRILVSVFSARRLSEEENDMHTRDPIAGFVVDHSVRSSPSDRRTWPLAASTSLSEFICVHM